MTHEEIIGLIKNGIPANVGGTWADFGAGRGAFTRALHDLLDSDATLYALDRDASALQNYPADVTTIHADFTKDALDLPPLDGLLMANALHFVMRQGRMMARIHDLLKPGGHFIIVEYTQRLPWTPFPVTYDRFAKLAYDARFADVVRIGGRTSPRNNVSMYAALARRPI